MILKESRVSFSSEVPLVRLPGMVPQASRRHQPLKHFRLKRGSFSKAWGRTVWEGYPSSLGSEAAGFNACKVFSGFALWAGFPLPRNGLLHGRHGPQLAPRSMAFWLGRAWEGA